MKSWVFILLFLTLSFSLVVVDPGLIGDDVGPTLDDEILEDINTAGSPFAYGDLLSTIFDCLLCEELKEAPPSEVFIYNDVVNKRLVIDALYTDRVPQDDGSYLVTKSPIEDSIILVGIYKQDGSKEIYKTYTNEEGEAVFDYSSLDDGSQCFKMAASYCPFCQESAPQCAFPNCLQYMDLEELTDEGILSIDDVPTAPGAAAPSLNEEIYKPSIEYTNYCPTTTNLNTNLAVCTVFFILLGLIWYSLMAAGKNPFGFYVDWVKPKGIPMKYMPRRQQASLRAGVILRAISATISDAKLLSSGTEKEISKAKKQRNRSLSDNVRFVKLLFSQKAREEHAASAEAKALTMAANLFADVRDTETARSVFSMDNEGTFAGLGRALVGLFMELVAASRLSEILDPLFLLTTNTDKSGIKVVGGRVIFGGSFAEAVRKFLKKNVFADQALVAQVLFAHAFAAARGIDPATADRVLALIAEGKSDEANELLRNSGMGEGNLLLAQAYMSEALSASAIALEQRRDEAQEVFSQEEAMNAFRERLTSFGISQDASPESLARIVSATRQFEVTMRTEGFSSLATSLSAFAEEQGLDLSNEQVQEIAATLINASLAGHELDRDVVSQTLESVGIDVNSLDSGVVDSFSEAVTTELSEIQSKNAEIYQNALVNAGMFEGFAENVSWSEFREIASNLQPFVVGDASSARLNEDAIYLSEVGHLDLSQLSPEERSALEAYQTQTTMHRMLNIASRQFAEADLSNLIATSSDLEQRTEKFLQNVTGSSCFSSEELFAVLDQVRNESPQQDLDDLGDYVDFLSQDGVQASLEQSFGRRLDSQEIEQLAKLYSERNTATLSAAVEHLRDAVDGNVSISGTYRRVAELFSSQEFSGNRSDLQEVLRHLEDNHDQLAQFFGVEELNRESMYRIAQIYVGVRQSHDQDANRVFGLDASTVQQLARANADNVFEQLLENSERIRRQYEQVAVSAAIRGEDPEAAREKFRQDIIKELRRRADIYQYAPGRSNDHALLFSNIASLQNRAHIYMASMREEERTAEQEISYRRAAKISQYLSRIYESATRQRILPSSETAPTGSMQHVDSLARSQIQQDVQNIFSTALNSSANEKALSHLRDLERLGFVESGTYNRAKRRIEEINNLEEGQERDRRIFSSLKELSERVIASPLSHLSVEGIFGTSSNDEASTRSRRSSRRSGSSSRSRTRRTNRRRQESDSNRESRSSSQQSTTRRQQSTSEHSSSSPQSEDTTEES